MHVNATSATTTSSNANPLGGETGDMFLTLLTTQLKAQDPMSPMNPTEFVGQLVQFNTLGQILRIREVLEAVAGIQPDTSSGSAEARATGGY
jgi:flagellar basal-body rod modification protein FlgD